MREMRRLRGSLISGLSAALSGCVLIICMLTSAQAAWPAAGPAEAFYTGGEMPPAASVHMEGLSGQDGRFYVREDNCGITVLIREAGSWDCAWDGAGDGTTEYETAGYGTAEYGALGSGWYECVIDEREDTRRCAEAAGADGGLRIRYEPWEIASLLQDGEHSIRIRGFDPAGNPVGLRAEACGGVSVSDGEARFVLDTVCPVARFSVESEDSTYPDPRDGRYFLNGTAEIRMEIWEENPGSAFFAWRDSCSSGAYDAVAALPEGREIPLDPLPLAGGLLFRDAPFEEAVYFYGVGGSDAAGNPLLTEEGFADSGNAFPVVIDRTPPAGELILSGAEGVFGRAASDGSVSFLAPCQRGGGILTELRCDTSVEHSPVRISGTLRESDGAERNFESGDYSFGGSALCAVSEPGSYRLLNLRAEDLAGNAASYPDSGIFRMDARPPGLQIGVRESPAAGNLYRTDVTVSVRVSEEAGEGGTGIGDVTARVLVDGAEVSTSVLRRGERVLFEGEWGRPDPQWLFEGALAVPSSLDSDRIEVEVSAADNAGNVSSERLAFGIDAVPPEIRVSFEGETGEEGTHFNRARRAQILVRERHFLPELMEVDPGGEAEIGEWEERDGVWTLPVGFSSDGSYCLRVSGRDFLGNAAEAVSGSGAGSSFVIDRTPPEVSWFFEGADPFVDPGADGVVGAAGALILRVSDAHFEGGHALRFDGPGNFSGEARAFEEGELRIPFAEEGVYKCGGTVKDRAGNETPLPELRWRLDLTPPEAVIEGARQGESLTEAPQIRVRIRDVCLDPASVVVCARRADGTELQELRREENAGGTKERELVLTGTLPEGDGRWEVSVSARDLGGNRVGKTLSFVVNESGPRLTPLDPAESGVVLRQAASPEILVEDVDPVRILSARVNGRPAVYSFEDDRIRFAEIDEDGIYSIGLEVEDAAGHRARLAGLEFEIDRQAPAADLSIEGGGRLLHTEDVAVLLRSDDPDALLKEVRLDGEEAAEAGAVVSYKNGQGRIVVGREMTGGHALTVVLGDRAGNVSRRERIFFRIAPEGAGAVLVPAMLLLGSGGILLLRRRRRRGGML